MKELDANPKAIKHIELVRQLKNSNGLNVNGTQSLFVLANLEKLDGSRNVTAL